MSKGHPIARQTYECLGCHRPIAVGEAHVRPNLQPNKHWHIKCSPKHQKARLTLKRERLEAKVRGREMEKGEYRDNPTEARRQCRFCGAVKHHNGISTHERWCRARNAKERREWLDKHTHSELLPDLAKTIPAKIRAVPVANYGRNGKVSDEGPRVHLEISLDQGKLNELLSSIRIEEK
jgi:hypothetical protein